MVADAGEGVFKSRSFCNQFSLERVWESLQGRERREEGGGRRKA